MLFSSLGRFLKHVLQDTILNAIKKFGFPHKIPIDF